jgi:hypothetical protein
VTKVSRPAKVADFGAALAHGDFISSHLPPAGRALNHAKRMENGGVLGIASLDIPSTLPETYKSRALLKGKSNYPAIPHVLACSRRKHVEEWLDQTTDRYHTPGGFL